jgi:pimeloyl-ACP methyl ester carboxylesterase
MHSLLVHFGLASFLAPLVVIAPSGAADFSGLVELAGGRKIYLECRGERSPTVILVSGKGDGSGSWSLSAPGMMGTPVFAAISGLTRVCAYDRPGTIDPRTEKPAPSDPVLLPTTVGAGAADLEALLAAANVPPPYVIVGHSMGGLIARIVAADHGDQVAGLVLEDAFSEYFYDGMTEGERAVFDKASAGVEDYDLPTSMKQIRGTPPVRTLPTIVLSAGRSHLTPMVIASGELPPEVTQAFADGIWALSVVAQSKLAGLFPDARHTTVADSTHYIHLDQPNVVIDAITDVVDAVRAGDASLEK